MKALRRVRDVASTCLVALVVAALTFVVAHAVFHPSDPKMSLTAGSGFTITSGIHASSACSGSTAELDPGTTRYICFTVQNNLTVPITVGSISMALSNTPPAGCAASDLSLPTFSGPLNVSGSGSATTTGLPIELKDDGPQGPQCQGQTLDFVYSGSAQYTDSTSTSLATSSSGNTSTSGTPVTFTAAVTETNASEDPSGSIAGGTVAFESCTSPTCSGTPTQLGTGSVGTNGQATFATSALPVGTNYIEAIYGGSGTNLAGSASKVVVQTVNPSTVSTSSTLISAPNPSSYGTSVTLTDTVSASTGTPAGSVTFYSCSTSSCTSSSRSVLAGSEALSGGKVSLSVSNFPAGTTYVVAVYGGAGSDATSTSGVVSQVVNALRTTSSLTSSPNPATNGSSVTFSDTVSASTGTPAGTVTFYSCSTSSCSTKSSLGTKTLAAGKASYSTTDLLVGTTYVEAVYPASGTFATSTSNVASQLILNVPAVCTSGGYNDVIMGTNPPQLLFGTNGNDYISAFGGAYWIDGLAGNDCVSVGNGDDSIYEGDGNDGVAGGDGSDALFLGNGNDRVSLGNGSDWVQVGNGNDAITLGNGWGSDVVVGSGNDTVSLGNGSSDQIVGGNGSETIYLGSGIDNRYSGQAHHTNVCHLPTAPPSYHGSAASYYHDTITNCTVVTP